MPCTLEFDESVIDKLKDASEQKIRKILSELNRLKGMDSPTDKGGSYQKELWAYPVTGRSALICRINVSTRTIRIIDIVYHL